MSCYVAFHKQEHSLAKALLQQRRGLYFFHTHKCLTCGAHKTEFLSEGEEGEMRLEHRDTSTGCVYDCCWVVNGRPRAILEVYHTHACTAEKLEAIRATGAVVLAEFNSEEVIRALHATPIGPVELFNRLEDKEWQCAPCEAKAAADALARGRVMKHVIPFGYHKGRTVEDLCKGGRRYLVWVAGYNVSTQNRRDDTVRQSDAWKRVNSRYIETVQAARTALEGCCWLCDENVDAPWKTICKSCFKKERCIRRAGGSPTPYGDYVAGIPCNKQGNIPEQRLLHQSASDWHSRAEAQRLEAEALAKSDWHSRAEAQRLEAEALAKSEELAKSERRMRMQEVREAYQEANSRELAEVEGTVAYARLMARWLATMSAAEAVAYWNRISASYQRVILKQPPVVSDI